MANTCFTTYRIVPSNVNKDAFNKLIDALSKFADWQIHLGDLADELGVEWRNKGYSVRGKIVYWKERQGVIFMDVESAWSACDDLFEDINKTLSKGLSISYREEEPGCDIFYIHDERGFFPDNYFVDAYGGDFECSYFETLEEVIDYWCKCMKCGRGDKTDEQMRAIIEEWEYDDDDTFFFIHEFTRC